jgi:hypothetical protein
MQVESYLSGRDAAQSGVMSKGPRPGQREVITDEWRAKVKARIEADGESYAVVGKAIGCSKSMVHAMLNPKAGVGSKPVGTSSLARALARHSQVPLPVQSLDDDVAELVQVVEDVVAPMDGVRRKSLLAKVARLVKKEAERDDAETDLLREIAKP